MMRLPAHIPDLNPQQLIELVKLGVLEDSQAAMAEIYQRYKMDVWRFVRSKVNCDDVADDIAMDAWAYAIDNIHNFKWRSGEGDKLKAWLFQIAHFKRLEFFRVNQANESFDELTDTQLNARRYIASLLSRFDQDKTDVMPDYHLAIDVQREADRILQAALKKLSETQRQIIILIYYRGVETTADVATILGFPPGKKSESKIRVYHKRALDKLSKDAELAKYLER